MSELKTLVSEISNGLQRPDHVDMNNAISEIYGWSKDGNHTQKQIDQSLKSVNSELHKQGLLTDLQIVGADDQNHLVARDAHNKTVTIDEAGRRSDAQQMAEKALSALNSGRPGEHARDFSDAMRSIYQREREITGAERGRFDSQVNFFLQQAMPHTQLVESGQNMRHGGVHLR